MSHIHLNPQIKDITLMKKGFLRKVCMTPEIFGRCYGNIILDSYHHQIVSYTKI